MDDQTADSCREIHWCKLRRLEHRVIETVILSNEFKKINTSQQRDPVRLHFRNIVHFDINKWCCAAAAAAAAAAADDDDDAAEQERRKRRNMRIIVKLTKLVRMQ